MEGERGADLIRAQLRRMRIAAGLNQEEFGRRAAYSGSLVSSVETGTRPLDLPYVKRADEVLETGGLFESLLNLAELAGQPSWFRPWLDAERAADQLRCYQPTLIPGLLQTEAYARAVIRCDDKLTDAQVEKRLSARMDRQSILDREEPPQFVVVLDEIVLRRVDESFQGVMAEQIHHLIGLAERPTLSVHIVPADIGMHVGLTGPFILARGADGGWVGNLENQLGGVVVDKDEALATLLSRWETVRNEALSRRQSTELMKEVVKSWT
ncbi:helix-turn-helix transcriptional regulator [Micromonospora sp. WMMD980]|uniref:helix-turn-helix domain-containing protein n=1 Tax=Micromonospora sp. WMMD980 TaxID=3016088 RepID=UPI002416510B|nr:helix-turn-helix transcriptional regulator [Micromonospora sp. WMMD980]MDG4799892.1 helix-turn-helix transcriptional regulator [Micromonospora sp. WMMD980]